MTRLVLVSAADEGALVGELTRLIDFIDRVPDVQLKDVAYTCSLNHGEAVIAIIAEDAQSLRARLFSARSRIANSGVKRIRDKSGTYYFRNHLLGDGKGKLAFVYPGVTSFYPDMIRDLAIRNPECRGAFDELEEALMDDPSFTPSSFIFPPAPYYRHDADIFKSGAYAQALVATYTGCVALTRHLEQLGILPSGVVGFAGGDLAAMMRSRMAGDDLSRSDRIKVISEIYKIVHKAVNHGGLPTIAMYTVLLRRVEEAAGLATLPSDKVILAVDASPRQKTYAVMPDFEEEFVKAVVNAGAKPMKLDLDRPFNTPLCKSLVPAINKFATNWLKKSPICDNYSCATAELTPSRISGARTDLAERWTKPVRFVDTIRRMYADGYRVFLEVGPRGLMTVSVEDTLKDEEHAAIALDSIHRRGTLQIQHAIGQLAALGAKMDISYLMESDGARKLDFGAAISLEVRKNREMKLSREFPRMTLLSNEVTLSDPSIKVDPKGRGAKAATRAAAIAQFARRQRQFDFGAMNPLISDADTIASSPGVSIELTKVFKIIDFPFIGDYALGNSQLSYSEPNLRGLTLFTLPLGMEIMAEAATAIVPNRMFRRIEDLNCRRMVEFVNGELKLFIKAERVASCDPKESAVKVLIRDDSPNSEYTWPIMEATIVLAEDALAARPAVVDALSKPRSVHWSGRDIYPAHLCCGRRLRGIHFVEAWGESGLDYDVVAPMLAGSVSFTRFPMWVVDPLLTEVIASGFKLWRSHERFTGAFSFPFRLRRFVFVGPMPKEGSNLRCYLRRTDVTPKSHICDIEVTDGNGNELMRFDGWEELTERVPNEYRELVLQPANNYLTEELGAELLGSPATDVASAFVTDVPYNIFERNEELWLKTLSHIILDSSERKTFANMTGSVSRRTEWLFGRAAAKDAVRRFLKTFYQARWSDADIKIWADDSGKPCALGEWRNYLSTKLDIAIAHTAQFVVAIAAANARVGVDVESANRDLSEEFTNGVFTPEELELAAHTINASRAIVQFWCAKEAVSKALGTGIRYSPREMVVSNFIPDTGALTMRLTGAWVEAFKNFKGRDISVTVKLVRDHALASCFIPASLFVDED